MYADENVWLSQKMMGQLYDVDVRTISYHLKTIFSDSELQEDAVIQNFRITAADGKSYDTKHYNLSAIFAAAGLKNPDISILSDQFLADVRGMSHKNLAVELLRKLLNDEVKARSKHNLVQARSFAGLLEKSVRRYQNRAIQAAQVIEELIELAKDMRAAEKRSEDLGLSSDELTFYDALEVNDSAVQVLGDETLRTIARELVDSVRKN